jgi:formylglycine-generating enzyme required for sulfatase activity
MATQKTSIKQVFISHATRDAEFARRLAGDLQQLGISIWIAPESIRGGESWVDAIEHGLGESSHMLVVLTPAVVKSSWVKKETSVAIALEREGRMDVIPLNVQPCDVPLLLKSYQMVSFRRDYDTGFSQLAGVLGLSTKPLEPVRPPEMAQRTATPQVVHPAITKPRPPVEPELVLIPAGEFLMGSDPEKDEDARNDEQPQHRVFLPDYYIARTPVTNAQYTAFVEITRYIEPQHWRRGEPPSGKEDHPVVSVSWRDAVAYCRWLSEVAGKAYRLPSEAEWEKAARGTDGRIYPWGNEPPDESRFDFSDGLAHTTPVGSYPQGASPYGLLDMGGNVAEWTRSYWRDYPYNLADGREEDMKAGDEVRQVVRGGVRDPRCACRLGYYPLDEWNYVGFRLVASHLFPSAL